MLDTKLAKNPRPGHVLQLCFYSWLLTEAQGRAPQTMRVILGDGSERSFRYADYARYFQRLRARLAAFVANLPVDNYADPCAKCEQCRWSSLCETRRIQDDHLWQVAGISRLQTSRLSAAGITTMTALAHGDDSPPVPRMNATTLARLRTQARMQVQGKGAQIPLLELGAPEPGRGFHRLPPPSEGDLYFDIEGDPLHEDGLEYLFGVTWREGDKLHFRPFWAHSRTEEKLAFEAFMDFVAERIARHPDLHIYHYAAYENTALKKLMSLHGTREEAVDQLLRDGRLVDLYRVVVESIVASTPSYSIKEIEAFYRARREGEVKNAGASIVAYEQWRQTGDAAVLKSIEDYNRDDCESTAQLHAWLLGIRPSHVPWRPRIGAATEASPPAGTDPDKEARKAEAQRERAALVARLLQGMPVDPQAWTPDHHLRELAMQLLDFHRRCDKPVWWKIFSCRDMTDQELIDDIECIGLVTVNQVMPGKTARSRKTWICTYPEQDFKTREGARCKLVDTLEDVEVVHVDEGQRILHLRASSRVEAPSRLSLTPPGPVDARQLTEAVERFAKALAMGDDTHQAVRALLRKEPPRLRGRPHGAPLVTAEPVPIEQVIDAVAALDHSHLFIQGPLVPARPTPARA